MFNKRQDSLTKKVERGKKLIKKMINGGIVFTDSFVAYDIHLCLESIYYKLDKSLFKSYQQEVHNKEARMMTRNIRNFVNKHKVFLLRGMEYAYIVIDPPELILRALYIALVVFGNELNIQMYKLDMSLNKVNWGE